MSGDPESIVGAERVEQRSARDHPDAGAEFDVPGWEEYASAEVLDEADAAVRRREADRRRHEAHRRQAEGDG